MTMTSTEVLAQLRAIMHEPLTLEAWVRMKLLLCEGDEADAEIIYQYAAAHFEVWCATSTDPPPPLNLPERWEGFGELSHEWLRKNQMDDRYLMTLEGTRHATGRFTIESSQWEDKTGLSLGPDVEYIGHWSLKATTPPVVRFVFEKCQVQVPELCERPNCGASWRWEKNAYRAVKGRSRCPHSDCEKYRVAPCVKQIRDFEPSTIDAVLSLDGTEICLDAPLFYF